jgi:DNA repair protein RadC
VKYLRRLKVKFERGTFKNPIHGQISGPEEVYSIFKDIKDETKEVLLGVYLADDLQVRSYEVLTIGTRSMTLVSSTEVFRGAILSNSKYIVLIHNHPGGESAPSDEDRKTVEVLMKQAAIKNHYILDFIIVGAGGFWSYFDESGGGNYELGALTTFSKR